MYGNKLFIQYNLLRQNFLVKYLLEKFLYKVKNNNITTKNVYKQKAVVFQETETTFIIQNQIRKGKKKLFDFFLTTSFYFEAQ